MDIYARLKELGLELPPPPPPGGLYKPVKQAGNLLFVSGQGCTREGVPCFTGKVGAERTVEEGQEAARICVMNALSVLHDYLGDLNKVECLVRLQGFVASAEGFNMQPKVIDGASRLLRIFGVRTTASVPVPPSPLMSCPARSRLRSSLFSS